MIAGLLGTILALAVPFLPVNYDIATLKWPTAEGTKPVSPPLATHSPLRLDISIPCRTAQTLDPRLDGSATLVSANSPPFEYGKLTALFVQVDNGDVTFTSSGGRSGRAPLPGGDCTISVHSDGYRTVATVGANAWPRSTRTSARS